MVQTLLLRVAAAVLAMSAVASAAAAPSLTQAARAVAIRYTELGQPTDFRDGSSFVTSDGSSYRYEGCVGWFEDFLVSCSFPPDPPPFWYRWPRAPSLAAAQAHTPAFGVNRVRTHSDGIFQNLNTQPPGFTAFEADAQSSWRDEISTSAATPVVITFVVALHVNWNDGGLWAFVLGRPLGFDPDLGYEPVDGHTWANCAVQPASGLCRFEAYTGASQTLLPGGANGEADLIVTLDYTVYPESFFDPDDPVRTNVFQAFLAARSRDDGAEVEAFSTAQVRAVLVPEGAGIVFASGHAYPVQVVPEPATWALWGAGLLGLALRRARQTGGMVTAHRP